MAITTDEQALELISLIQKCSNTDIVPAGSSLFKELGDKVESFFSGIDDDDKKAHFIYALNTAGKQVGSISPSDYEELVLLMVQLFGVADTTEGATMLSLVQDVQRTDILDEGQVENYIAVLKALIP